MTSFNTKQQVFPTNMVALTLGFKTEELFQLAENGVERETPKVDLAV